MKGEIQMNDFLPEYLEMCEKATELQDAWQSDKGDYYCEKGSCTADSVFQITEILTKEEIADYKQKNIWIPYENQLYEMWQSQPYFLREAYNYFEQNIEKGIIYVPALFKNDIKIIHLMYAMRILCGKRWDFDNKEWVHYK